MVKKKTITIIIVILAVLAILIYSNQPAGQQAVVGDSQLQLLSSSVVTTAVEGETEVIVTSDWYSEDGGEFVLESEIALTSMNTQSVIDVEVNRCDILYGVEEPAWNYRNEKVTFSPGQTHTVNFKFRPESVGTYYAYVDALSDCRIVPADIISLTYVGQFEQGDFCTPGEEDQRDCDDGYKQVCYADGTGWGDCVVRCNPGETTSEGCEDDEVKECYADGTGWSSCEATEVVCQGALRTVCTLPDLPSIDDSGPSNDCKSGWCEDVVSVGDFVDPTIILTDEQGLCAPVPFGYEPHPDCKETAEGDLGDYLPWIIGAIVILIIFMLLFN